MALFIQTVFFHRLLCDDVKCGEAEQMKVSFTPDYQRYGAAAESV